MSREKRRKPKRHTKAQFEGLIVPLMDSLYGMALRLTRDEEKAADLVQEACLKAYRALNSFEPGTNFRAWVFRIMTNTFITDYHRRRREASSVTDLENRSHYQRFVGSGSTRTAKQAESQLLDKMMSDDIKSALDDLPEDFRQAVLLCDVEGFSYKEIAEILDCPIGTVMSRLYRGRRMLQNMLYDHAVEHGLITAKQAEENKTGNSGGDHDEEMRGEKAGPQKESVGGNKFEVARFEEYRKKRDR